VRDIPSRLEFLFFDIPALRPGTAGAYLLAFVSVGVATALRLAMDPYVGGLQFATFLPAVILTTLISGLGAGLFSVALSVAAIAFFVLPPRLSLYIEEPADLLAILLYSMVMLFNVSVITGMRLALARRRDQEALQESRERLQLALDTTQLGWWQYDPRRNVASWDSRGLEILGRAEEAPFAEFVRQIHPDDREGFLAARAAALAPSDPKLFVYAFRVIRKDGTVRWVESHGLPHFEGAGPRRQLVSLGGAIQDVTERKERDEKEHLLMREVNHRAKNMLSVVDAVARQTAARNPEDFIERFSERLQALSANQDLLIRNEWRGVEINELVRAQLAHFASLMGSRIAVSGPKVRFTPASAQAVGLALHELATNAGKYGALSTVTGRLEISWAVDGDTFTMTWTEREGPPVSAPEQRGFGTVVMQAMAERSVGGKVDLDYAPSGLTWRLTCPAGNALEA
jgi:PAS domain S-box-containing protein